MAVPDELRRHSQQMSEATGRPISLVEEGNLVYVIVSKVTLPAGAYAVATTDILFIADGQYPVSAMDMFWTELEVLLPGGAIPESAGGIEHYAGRPWRRFSWHRQGTWNRDGNPLLDHFEFAEHRFAQDLKG